MSGTEEDKEGRTKKEIPCQAPSDTTKAGSRTCSAEPSPFATHQPRAPRPLRLRPLAVCRCSGAIRNGRNRAPQPQRDPCVRAEARQYSPRPASQPAPLPHHLVLSTAACAAPLVLAPLLPPPRSFLPSRPVSARDSAGQLTGIARARGRSHLRSLNTCWFLDELASAAARRRRGFGFPGTGGRLKIPYFSSLVGSREVRGPLSVSWFWLLAWSHFYRAFRRREIWSLFLAGI